MKSRKQRALAILFISLCLPAVALCQGTVAKEPVAVIGGKAVYEDELLPLMIEQLQEIRNQEYEIKSRALEQLINQKVLEAEAAKKGMSVDALLDRNVTAAVPDPTDSEVEAFYLGQKDRLNRPLNEIRQQLRENLKQTKLQQTRSDFIQRLWSDSQVGILLSPPRTEVAYDLGRVRGDAAAPITIVEFSDFQCPFCRTSFPIVKQLLEKYAGKIKIAYRDYPLHQIHPQAHIAAEGARCAGEQGKFWEYHDLLFTNQDKLDQTGLIQHAKTLKLNQRQFETCLGSGKYKPAIEADVQAAAKARVSGTPAFFINGIAVTGAQPASAFERIIDAELTRIAQQPASR
jgi:predicted DsbA family dithiol-disulfide isomerase